jgi:hypothetical protein
VSPVIVLTLMATAVCSSWPPLIMTVANLGSSAAIVHGVACTLLDVRCVRRGCIVLQTRVHCNKFTQFRARV